MRDKDGAEGLEGFLDTDEIIEIKAHRNLHLAILQLNTLHIAKLRDQDKLNIFGHVQINNTQVNLSNAMGMAKRIKTTVISYT